ncbi:hypothetical protein M433DRAFT_512317 [Acidomyces richmondensis BFW]|nr:MAG: hypothetical protein FE78DRAFT_319169 [Acidomyces sp. 'richmondensis']KYG47151.1 hypothetical protein M433DRAFT_512317 [Acidomyces richmondensis BFW]
MRFLIGSALSGRAAASWSWEPCSSSSTLFSAETRRICLRNIIRPVCAPTPPSSALLEPPRAQRAAQSATNDVP